LVIAFYGGVMMGKEVISRRGTENAEKERGQRSEVRGQRSEVRGQKSEVRGQRSEVIIPIFDL
jgi:hypothetical protein